MANGNKLHLGPRSWLMGAFFLYSIIWLLLLAAGALLYGASPHVDFLPYFTFTFNDVMPLWVPWAGALGGAAISLVGTTEHALNWDSNRYAYWHLARPALGAVFGVIGVLAIVLVLQGISPESKDGLYTAKGTAILSVIAFLLGYREETFRELVKRLVDTLVKPAAAAADALLTLSPPTVEFGDTTPLTPITKTLFLINRTSSPLTLKPEEIKVDSPTVVHGVTVPMTIAAGADGQILLTWTPTGTGPLNGQVNIQTAATTLGARLTGHSNP